MKPLLQDPLLQSRWDATLKALQSQQGRVSGVDQWKEVGELTYLWVHERLNKKYELFIEKEGGRPETKPPSSW